MGTGAEPEVIAGIRTVEAELVGIRVDITPTSIHSPVCIGHPPTSVSVVRRRDVAGTGES